MCCLMVAFTMTLRDCNILFSEMAAIFLLYGLVERARCRCHFRSDDSVTCNTTPESDGK